MIKDNPIEQESWNSPFESTSSKEKDLIQQQRREFNYPTRTEVIQNNLKSSIVTFISPQIDQHLPHESNPIEAPTGTFGHYHQSSLPNDSILIETLRNICSQISLDKTTSTIYNNSSLPIAEIHLS
ncbi:hypothetical protein AVEN_154413-1 [Araneus ventricosus]|uniref:Uncharacterized protein n=1 Tax=Araneus ventricosus TaxID=182803 RepID=A0A4Y2KGD1_ARAVE|nr:hypothetical protein AVEN_154413-1 [Araneus ventricosus]